MLGSGPGDGDFIELGPEKPRRTWPVTGRSRRILTVVGVCALLAAGAVFATVRLSSSGPANSALAQLITAVTTVPESETVPAIETVPAPASSGGTATLVSGNPDTQSPPNFSGSASFAASASTLLIDPSVPAAVSGPPLTAGGKPELLYIATEYCPYCVAESWALIVALSRFGAFSGLSTSRSAAFEHVPPVDGWTFYRSSYSSRYLTFVPVETASYVQVSPGTGQVAGAAGDGRRLTPGEQAVFTRLDQGESTPFLDFGGRAVQTGTDVSPHALAHLTWSQIAAALRHPGSAAGKTILASVDTLTAELCRLTGARPAAACPKA